MHHLWRRLRMKGKHAVLACRSLDWRHDGWLFLRMLSLAAVTPLLMRQRLPVVQAWLTVAPPIAPTAAEIARRLHCMTVIMALGRPFIQPRCLTRGVTLYYFLRRAGLPVELHFGVQSAATFTGHCWLVLDGQPFAEPCDPTAEFTTVYHLR